MTSKICADPKCGHDKWKHAFLRDKFQFCKECDCKKFIHQKFLIRGQAMGKTETCAKCGFTEEEHKHDGKVAHIVDIGKAGFVHQVLCKKFKPKEAQTPQNHSPQGHKVGLATGNPAKFKDTEPEEISNDKLDNHSTSGSDNASSLSDKKCYAYNAVWYPEKDVKEFVKKVKE